MIKKLSTNFPYVTLYKLCIKPHLDYTNLIYDKPNNDPFYQKSKNAPYRPVLTTTGTIQGTSRGTLYQGLGHESRSD